MKTDSGNQRYWDHISAQYAAEIRISIADFHYGPLLHGDSHFKLLPQLLKGLDCLELGCGGGQNSIYLASQGATCTALDVSGAQLAQARANAAAAKVQLEFIHAPMKNFTSFTGDRQFDLIHSVHALSFSPCPAEVIENCAKALKPGGTLIFSLLHALFAGEHLEVDDDDGIFLSSYFNPPPDIREENGIHVCSNYYPVSTVTDWVLAAGLRITALREPEIAAATGSMPYKSESWLELSGMLEKIPSTLIVRADRSPA